MAIEIEHKFLIHPEHIDDLMRDLQNIKPSYISQGYLNTDKERTVRVRIRNKKAYFTVKGKPVGLSKKEFEYEMPLADAKEMIEMCTVAITKERYVLDAGNGLSWEVDIFKGQNEGLILAEIEVPSENTPFAFPSWLGEDISQNYKYYNSQLALKPFNTWTKS